MVQLLEDTPILSLGKVKEDHRYSHEWTSGQKPHLIKHGRNIFCNVENCVPVVVPGLTTGSCSSRASTSSTSVSQDPMQDDSSQGPANT